MQEKEANLDIIMDRMRQDASEYHLKDSLKKALQMLDLIKAGYALKLIYYDLKSLHIDISHIYKM